MHKMKLKIKNAKFLNFSIQIIQFTFQIVSQSILFFNQITCSVLDCLCLTSHSCAKYPGRSNHITLMREVHLTRARSSSHSCAKLISLVREAHLPRARSSSHSCAKFISLVREVHLTHTRSRSSTHVRSQSSTRTRSLHLWAKLPADFWSLL